jgi:glutamine synthetase
MKPAEAKNYLKQHDVKYVLAQFVDVHGAAKAKSVPVEHYRAVASLAEVGRHPPSPALLALPRPRRSP